MRLKIDRLPYRTVSFCLNPDCQQPKNPIDASFCLYCGSKLLLGGDRYRALQPIGAGGFGRTFLAADEYKPSKLPCIIKQFRPQNFNERSQEKAIALFEREAKQLDRLGEHPQIPALLAYLIEDGRQYLIQEYVSGQNLEEELADAGPFDEAKIDRLLNSLLPVLAFVHDRKVIHRDIKPANIIRRQGDGQIFLVDFGAAKTATATTLVRTGTTIGSAGFAAPEQAQGKAYFASDIYSLGVTCIYLLTQVPPFDLFDEREGKWVWRDFLVNRTVSDRLGNILDKMLQIPTKHRYSSATKVLQDLKPYIAKTPKVSKSQTRSQTGIPLQKSSAIGANASTHNQPALTTEEATQKRVNTSYALWLVGFVLGTAFWPLPVMGVHRFYNGQIVAGLLFSIPFASHVWGVVDLFLIPGMSRRYEEEVRSRALQGSPTGGFANAIAQTIDHLSTAVPAIAPEAKEEMRKKILQAAQRRNGRLTVTQAVMDTGIAFGSAKVLLQEMVADNYVSVEVDTPTGTVTYLFHEL